MKMKFSAIILISTVLFVIPGISYGWPYNPPPTVYITSPEDGNSYQEGVNITIDANASDDGNVEWVELYANDQLLPDSCDINEPYSYTWNDVQAGVYALKARAYDDEGASTYSEPVNISVGVILVDIDANGTNDGTSWENAFNHLQDALTEAVSGSVIWVAEGTYKPDINDLNNRSATFQLKEGVEIYGGFKGNETELEQRDWFINKTILSGDINDIGNPNDNSYHVVTGADDANLDGFIITNGNADGSYPDCYGGGIYCYDVSPTISNCLIKDNNSTILGGGIYCDYGSPTVTNSFLIGNSSVYA